MSANKRQNDSSEDILSKLYRTRKEQIKAPDILNKRLFKPGNASPWYQSFGNFFKYSALLATIAVVVMIFGIQILQHNIKPTTYVDIEVHSLASEGASTFAAEHRVKYDSAYNDYMMTLELNKFNDQKIGRLIENSDTGIKLLTCEKEVIQITKALLKTLQLTPTDKIQPHIGDMMALNMDDKGRILQLNTNTDIKECPTLAD